MRRKLFSLKLAVVLLSMAYLVGTATTVISSGKDKPKENDIEIDHIVFMSDDYLPCAGAGELLGIPMAGEAKLERVSFALSTAKSKETPKKECKITFSSEDEKMLKKIAMAEARGESVEGKALVMNVVINRVLSDKFPDTIKEVIEQDGQFSPVASGIYQNISPDEECDKALELIKSGWDESNQAMYFESVGKSGWHARNLLYLFQYGNHYFYTERSQDESI